MVRDPFRQNLVQSHADGAENWKKNECCSGMRWRPRVQSRNFRIPGIRTGVDVKREKVTCANTEAQDYRVLGEWLLLVC